MARVISRISFSSYSCNFLSYPFLKLVPFFSPNPTIAVGLSLLGVFFSLLTIPSQTMADEEYRFERMWPTLQQPWYFYSPFDIALDADGNIYVADTDNHRIQKFTSNGQFVTKWGSEGDGDGEFNEPSGIGIDSSGYVYVAETSNHRIQKFSSDGQFIAEWGVYGTGDGEFDAPAEIAFDSGGYIYVVESGNHRVQKFTSDGQFVTKWGGSGNGDGKFSEPSGIAIDSTDNVYVADSNNHRIQKFTSDGQFVTKWGSDQGEGSGDGEFSYPDGIAIDSSGYVYVADPWNYRIQKFTSDGQFVTKWEATGSGDGEFNGPSGIAIDSSDNVYVADTYNHRIQKFTSDGQFVAKLASSGGEDGEFAEPSGIAIDSSGYVYVADSWNHRIQKFTSNGQFVEKWGTYGDGNGQFDYPTGIAVDNNGYVYVADIWNYRIQKFTSVGHYVTEWGTYGSGEGEFDAPTAIAFDSSGYVYVVDSNNHRIQKFTSDGQFVSAWGSEGSGNGQYSYPSGIALDSNDNVYVVDAYNNRVQKVTSGGQFVAKWGSLGDGDGEFFEPTGIAVDANGYVLVTDSYNNRVQKFTSDGQFVTKWGSLGSDPGMFSLVSSVAVDSGGRVFVSEHGNNRIQVFSTGVTPTPGQKDDKAIIVAGSGPFPGNNIWDATSMLANFAYRTLTYQGYTKDTIYYLSADTDLDIDGNGILDDVDADATNSNFQSAITNWAGDAETLFIYMAGHGGSGTFRMGATELLQASVLDSWLDNAQGTIPGTVALVYDACRSGSFLETLLPPFGKERILVTSSSADEEAIFSAQGSISFSFLFWGRMFNGDSFYDSFVNAKSGIGVTYNQNPLLEGNGNGIGNERADQDAARQITIGNETRTGGDIPVIGSVSPAQTLSGQTSATIYAADVIDADGISRVWAIITPPDYSPGSPETPVTNLPTLDLTSVGNNRYEGTYNNFISTGTYNIAIYAADAYGIISLPTQTTVTQGEGEEEPSPPCPATIALEKEEDSLSLLKRFRDEVLAEDVVGQEYIDLFYHHAPEVSWLLLRDAGLRSRTGHLLRTLLPHIRSLLQGEGVSITYETTEEIESLLDQFEAEASPEFQDTIRVIEEDFLNGAIFELALGSKCFKQVALRSSLKK